jgi:hypothetical protein
MEKVLNSKCSPPDTRRIIKEKELIIQKQSEKIKSLESYLNSVLKERDFFFNLFVKLINNGNESNNEFINNELKLCSTTSLNSISSHCSSASSLYYSILLSPNAVNGSNLSDKSKEQSENVNCLSLIQQHVKNSK